MANRVVGAVTGLVGGQVAGRALSLALKSGPGERLLERLDGHPLTPLEHRVLVNRWSGSMGKALSASVAVLAVLWTARRQSTSTPEGRGDLGVVGRGGSMSNRRINWVQVLQRAAEVLVALGAIFKVVGEFLEDRQKTTAETQRRAARRLA